MRVVSNTLPLLNLAIIGHLALVRQQFGEVWIPPLVVEELRIGTNMPGSHTIREAMEAGWLRAETVQDNALVQLLQRELDGGEAEAIALALQTEADFVLLDEREARRIAKSLGLKVTGVLGILLRARGEGHIVSLKAVMERLRAEAGFRISEQLFIQMLQQCGEE